MKKIIFFITIFATLNLCNGAEISVGRLKYSIEPGTNPINQLPSAEVYTDQNNDKWETIRFPGTVYFYNVEEGYYPGWSSEYQAASDTVKVTSPRGYIYIFEHSDGNSYRLKTITNANNEVEDRYVYDSNDGLIYRIYDGDATAINPCYIEFQYNTNRTQITSITAVDQSVSSSSGTNYSRSYTINYDTNDRVSSITNSGASGCGCSGGGDDWIVEVLDADENLIEEQNSVGSTLYTYEYGTTQGQPDYNKLIAKRNADGKMVMKYEYENLAGGGRKEKVYECVEAELATETEPESYIYRYSETVYDSEGAMESVSVFKEERDSTDTTHNSTSYTTTYLYDGTTYTTIPDGGSASGERTVEIYNSDYQLTENREYDSSDNYRKTQDIYYYTSGSADGFEKYNTDLRELKTYSVYTDDSGNPTTLLQKQYENYDPDNYTQKTYRKYGYDSQNRLTTETLKIDDVSGGDDSADTTLQTLHYEYDSYGNINKEYLNNLSNRSNPDALVTEYVYNAFGDLVWQISPAGVVTGRVYDSASRVTDEFVLAGGITTFNAYKDPQTGLDPNPLNWDLALITVISQTKYEYHSLTGKREYVKIALCDGSFPFDSPDNWNIIQYGYDLYGRKTSEIRGYGVDNLTTTYAYNLQDEVVLTTDPANKKTLTIRGGRGLTKEVQLIDANDSQNKIITSYIYDNRGRLEQTLVNNTIIKSYEYDDYGRTEKEYNGNNDGSAADYTPYHVEYTYQGDTDDAAIETVWDEDLTGQTVAVSKTFKYYDILGQVVFEQNYSDPSMADSLEDSYTFYQYDSLGNMIVKAGVGVGNYCSVDPYWGIPVYNSSFYTDNGEIYSDYPSSSQTGDIIELFKYDGNGLLIGRIKGYAPNILDELYDYNTSTTLYEGLFECSLDDFETYINDINPDLHYTRYQYINGRLDNESIYTELVDNGSGSFILDFVETSRYSYDTGGRRDTVTRMGGVVYEKTLNSAGQVIEQVVTDSDTTILRREQVYYDILGRKIREAVFKDPDQTILDLSLDKVTDYEYNTCGQLCKKKVATGETTLFMQFPIVELLPITDDTTITYDGFGRKYTVTDAAGNCETLNYDPVTGKIATRSRLSVSEITGVNDVTVVEAFGYDPASRLISKAETGFTGTATYAYHGGNLVRETLFDGTVNEYIYDGFGNMIEAIKDVDMGVQGKTYVEQYTDWNYDRLGRQYEITAYTDGNSTANAETTTYTYDYMDNITQVEYDDGSGIRYYYNKLGNTEVRVVLDDVSDPDSDGVETEYSYDAGGFLAEKNNIDYALPQDPEDPLIRESRPWCVYGHDGLGRLVSTWLLDTGGQQMDFSLYQCGYDGLGNVEWTQDGFWSGAGVSYEYYSDGRLKSVTGPSGLTTYYNRDEIGRVVSIEDNSNLLTQYGYVGGRVVDTYLGESGFMAAGSIDARGRIGQEAVYDTVSQQNVWVNAYTYQPQTDRLSSKTIGSDVDSYGYDDLGRLESYDSEIFGINNISYSLNDIGEETAAPSDNYVYGLDGEGRVKRVGLSTSDTNSNGILDESEAAFALYTYDSLGRRIKKAVDVDDGSGGTETLTTWFVYDMIGNVITECKESDTGSVSWSHEYVYSDDSRAVYMRRPRTKTNPDWADYDNFISTGLYDFAEAWLCYPSCSQTVLTAWDSNSDDRVDFEDLGAVLSDIDGDWEENSRLLATDYRGSVIGIVTADQTAIEPIYYDAWGNSVIQTGTDLDGLNVLWNGYYSDADTGNYYLKNRYYSPVERKFLTEDPHGVNPDGNWNNRFSILNQYADGAGLDVYAGHDPVNGRDDWGLACGVVVKRTTSRGSTGENRGHEWISWQGGSISFWPNGAGQPGKEWSVFSPDPLDGHFLYTTLWSTKQRKRGNLRWGGGKGTSCKCATCKDIVSCVSSSPDPGWQSFSMINNCRRYTRRTIKGCCLKREFIFMGGW
ncbi:YD repeat (two copies) [Limihaloglobus sulfuriphilus]|uniref:YD repeat (Two copies) n=1 Tax=Limihaloglobus sulfuriphilus TaxID=1851148 RepID=A0A1Q2MFK2_9BACT|nr:RHS repeat-associated core domain-containing protein [Limihaloglobus sulfuriphilus]AQQ71439.1 YD repeat (two copies) [Limihaloglobus sulfuriphilus]